MICIKCEYKIIRSAYGTKKGWLCGDCKADSLIEEVETLLKKNKALRLKLKNK